MHSCGLVAVLRQSLVDIRIITLKQPPLSGVWARYHHPDIFVVMQMQLGLGQHICSPELFVALQRRVIMELGVNIDLLTVPDRALNRVVMDPLSVEFY